MVDTTAFENFALGNTRYKNTSNDIFLNGKVCRVLEIIKICQMIVQSHATSVYHAMASLASPPQPTWAFTRWPKRRAFPPRTIGVSGVCLTEIKAFQGCALPSCDSVGFKLTCFILLFSGFMVVDVLATRFLGD